MGVKNKRLLISLAGALYLAAFIAGGCELVAHTGGDLVQTVICGPIVGVCAAAIVGGLAAIAASAVSGWWGWVREG